jgi:lysophospholipase L1-like esterase
MKHYSLLCLGDSYTIGEGVPLHENFPYQTLQLLRKAGHHFYAPEIIAKTGWTNFELAEHLLHHQLEEHYDFVTLLIGVNNQYRGLSAADFKEDFEFLLRKALHYAKQIPEHVIVVSIPDWGVTPFAKDHDTMQVAAAIDEFNSICKTMADQYAVHFIDITNDQRKDGSDTDFLAADILHPSAKEYAKWAEKIFERMDYVIKDN